MVAGFGAFQEKGKSPKPLRTVAAPDFPERTGAAIFSGASGWLKSCGPLITSFAEKFRPVSPGPTTNLSRPSSPVSVVGGFLRP